ncbi:16S rRNA (guanine(966)-N(2))-methyltransferase [hydrothermal vent metagenome]|uniref:16S rRNA (Guanine(966)-N(2))-methyltransferase n=1 Tax=hydrothermal vent metagenome TaxID=652676 RepID=A0A3B0WNB8_9ZZZZ
MAGKLRIIGGQWRRRLLPVVDLPGLRPTTDRIRETLFNWLQNEIVGAHCLDLFAGSGALGFEAASRGAASVTLLELQKSAVQILTQNIITLNAQNINLSQCDAVAWLSSRLTDASIDATTHIYDIVFIDPPFDSQYLDQVCELLVDHPCLSKRACIYLEMNAKQALPELPDAWQVMKEKKAGQVRCYLIKIG